MSDRQDNFYKASINSRQGNVFTRLNELEEKMRGLLGKSSSTVITQLIQQNKEIILSSVAGGTVDPTAEDFTGIVISPTGQIIDGVLYNFALVENGVVLTGLGQDINNVTNNTIIQGQDFVGAVLYPYYDYIFGNTFSQVVPSSSISIDRAFSLVTGGYDTIGTFTHSAPNGVFIAKGRGFGKIWLSCSIAQTANVRITLTIDDGVVDPIVWEFVKSVDLDTSPVGIEFYSQTLDTQKILTTEPVVTLLIEVEPSSDADFTLHSAMEESLTIPYVSIPLKMAFSGGANASLLTYNLSQKTPLFFVDGGNLSLDFSNASGTVTETCSASVQHSFPAFTSIYLGIPKIFAGLYTANLYLSSTVDQVIDIEVEVSYYDGTSTSVLATMSLASQEITSLVQLFELSADGVAGWSQASNGHHIVTLKITASSTDDITLHYDSYDKPSYVSVPMSIYPSFQPYIADTPSDWWSTEPTKVAEALDYLARRLYELEVFTPATSGDWDTAPETIDNALNELGSRTTALEAGGGGGGVATVSGDGVDNTDPSNPVISYPTPGDIGAELAGAAATAENNAKTYADGLVVGLWDDRGSFDASGGAYPSSGGSGTAGAIKKGDAWTVSVAGTLPTGQVVEVGDVVRALVDTPGNTQANWAITQNNIGYVAENSANKATGMTGNETSNILYLTAKAIYDWAIGLFSQIGHTHDAADLTFTPSTLADWTSSADPGDVTNALDQLALRTTDLEGAGGVSATQVEIDLGSTWIWRGKFTITDAAITAAKKVLVWLAPGPYTGKGTRADEAELTPIQILYVEPASGSAVVSWETKPEYGFELDIANGSLSTLSNNLDAFKRIHLIRKNKVRGNVKFLYTIMS